MNRIDYAEIRRRIAIRQVLDLIKYQPVDRRGDQWRGPCPLCGTPARADQRSFSVNVGKNVFRCFRCQRSGNQLDLWAAFSGLPLYHAAIDLRDKLNVAVVKSQIPQPRNRL